MVPVVSTFVRFILDLPVLRHTARLPGKCAAAARRPGSLFSTAFDAKGPNLDFASAAAIPCIRRRSMKVTGSERG